MPIEPDSLADVISTRSTDRGAQPDLLVRDLPVQHVDTELTELDCEDSVRESGVPSGEAVMVLYQITEPVTDALQSLTGQPQVTVLFYVCAESSPRTE